MLSGPVPNSQRGENLPTLPEGIPPFLCTIGPQMQRLTPSLPSIQEETLPFEDE